MITDEQRAEAINAAVYEACQLMAEKVRAAGCKPGDAVAAGFGAAVHMALCYGIDGSREQLIDEFAGFVHHQQQWPPAVRMQ